MKNILNIIALALLITACGKVTDSVSGGPYTIKGRLLNNCEEQKPVANELLYFLVNNDIPEEERIAYTDEDGYFEYSYQGPGNNESVIGGTISLEADKPVLCGIPNFPSEKTMDAGIIYKNNPREAEILFKINGNGYTDQDTLFLSRSFHTDLRKNSMTKLAGPFDDGIELSMEWIKYASDGTPSMGSWVQISPEFTRRLYGTFGTSAYWQIIDANGALGEVEKEAIFLETCENKGVIDINLNDAN